MAAMQHFFVMVIEAWIGDEVVKRHKLPDELLQEIDTMTPEENFEFRRSLIAQEVRLFDERNKKLFHPLVQICYVLVFQSKMQKQ